MKPFSIQYKSNILPIASSILPNVCFLSEFSNKSIWLGRRMGSSSCPRLGRAQNYVYPHQKVLAACSVHHNGRSMRSSTSLYFHLVHIHILHGTPFLVLLIFLGVCEYICDCNASGTLNFSQDKTSTFPTLDE